MNGSIFSLSGKVALVTGGGTGIGLGVSKALVDAGAKVTITGRREGVLKAAVESLGENARYFVNDITRKAGIPGLVRDIEGQWGPVDILVNNAGLHLKREAQETTDAEFEEVLQTNLMSVFALTRECAKGMIDRRQGCIILIGSMAGNFGVEKVVAYGTSKAALDGLMNNLVTEYSRYNVRINVIAPGWIDSDMFQRAIKDDALRKEKILNRIAMRRFGSPEDIGHTVVFLASDAARYITGVRLSVDGGATVNF
jgi:NAD(P)-dependent dehydrogenase (short-subunit alcohol dehydrogenase family)